MEVQELQFPSPHYILYEPLNDLETVKFVEVWHAEFLTSACQQMLRRQLEQRSFRNRVWFHVENPAGIQGALISRCITKRMPTTIRIPEYIVKP